MTKSIITKALHKYSIQISRAVTGAELYGTLISVLIAEGTLIMIHYGMTRKMAISTSPRIHRVVTPVLTTERRMMIHSSRTMGRVPMTVDDPVALAEPGGAVLA